MKSATVIACNAHHSLIDIKSFPILHKSSLSVNDNCQGCCFFMAFTVLVIFKTFGVFFLFLNPTDLYAGSLFSSAVNFDTFFMQSKQSTQSFSMS